MYEIWHSETNNIIDWFDTASQAEDAILAALEKQGEAVLDSTYMVRDDGGDEVSFLAEGRNILTILRILRLLDEVHALTPPEGDIPGASDIARLVESLPSLDKFGSQISVEWMKGFIAHGVLSDTPSTNVEPGFRIESPDSIRKVRRLIGQSAS